MTASHDAVVMNRSEIDPLVVVPPDEEPPDDELELLELLELLDEEEPVGVQEGSSLPSSHAYTPPRSAIPRTKKK